MKNKAFAALAAIVLLFSGFTGGFFLGRNTRVDTIQTTKTVYETVPGETVIVMQEVPVTLPPETTAPQSTTEPAGPTTGSNAPQNTPPKETTPKTTRPKEPEVTFPVNINTATARELDALPGIGEVIAQRIIDYRNAHGPFGSVDELINVNGIGEKKLADVKPYATE